MQVLPKISPYIRAVPPLQLLAVPRCYNSLFDNDVWQSSLVVGSTHWKWFKTRLDPPEVHHVGYCQTTVGNLWWCTSWRWFPNVSPQGNIITHQQSYGCCGTGSLLDFRQVLENTVQCLGPAEILEIVEIGLGAFRHQAFGCLHEFPAVASRIEPTSIMVGLHRCAQSGWFQG